MALVPFALYVEGLPRGNEGARRATRGGFLLGLVYFGILLYWMVVALIWYTPLAIAAYAATVLVLSALMAGVGWTLHRALREGGLPLFVALPAVWTAAEWFRAHWGDLAFPWLGLGHALTGYPELVGAAELVGARGITLWIALVNGLAAHLVLGLRGGGAPRGGASGPGGGARRRRTLTYPAVALAAVALLPPLWGLRRARTLPLRPAARVAVVQPNIPEHIKLSAREAVDSTLKALDALMPRIRPGSVDLVVWPEVTFPAYVEAPGAAPLRERIRAYSRAAGAPILFGALRYELTGDGGYTPFNSAFLATADGLTGYSYDKHFLVPFVERVPFVDPGLFGNLRYFGAFGKGKGWPLARAGGASFGVLICYESSFPQASRAYRRAGADFLVNITNDAWYGREPWYARTAALWQHPAHLVMRAIEHRVGVARAANTGISLFVDPVGRIHRETELFREAVRVETVLTGPGPTVYTRVGDVAGTGSAFFTGLFLLWSQLPGPRRRRG